MARFGADLEREMRDIRPPSFGMGDLQRRRQRRQRVRRFEAGVVAFAVAGAGAFVVLRALPDDSPPVPARRPHVVAAYPVGDRPSGVAFADGSLWVGHRTLPEVWRVDPATGAVQARIATGAGAPTLVAAGDGQVWAAAASPRGSTLLRIDPAAADVVASRQVPVVVSALAVADGRVWLASKSDDMVLVLSAEGRQLASIPVRGGPAAITVDTTAAFVAGGLDGRVTRIAVDGFRASQVAELDGRPTGIAPCGRALWVSTGEGALARVDPGTGRVRTSERGRFLAAVASDGGVVWTVDGAGGGAVAVDCSTGRALGSVRGGREPTAVVAVAGHAWIVDTGGGLLTEAAL